MNNYYYGEIGGTTDNITPTTQRKYTVIQSLWTKPITDKAKLTNTLIITALSLAYAHRSGYKVHMHTDSRGYELLKGFGYEKLYKTLDNIPDTVPIDLFAAGKFFAMQAEGTTGKVHIDIDVFLKKPGVIERFYKDKTVDVICQMDEDMSFIDHNDIIQHMHVMGYPAKTRPSWHGSINTGVVGFNNTELAEKYMGNYFEALEMYTNEKFEQYKQENKVTHLLFDFVLEQINLSYMSVGYNVQTLVPTKNPSIVADKIGYQHLQGSKKWTEERLVSLKAILKEINKRLYSVALSKIRSLDNK